MAILYSEKHQKICGIFLTPGENKVDDKKLEEMFKDKWFDRLMNNGKLAFVKKTEKKKPSKKKEKEFLDLSNVNDIEELEKLLDKASTKSEKEAIAVKIQQIADNEIEAD